MVDHRNDLVKHRVQTVNRLHVLLVPLIPAGARHLSADVAAGLLRRVRPHDPAVATLRSLAVELVPEVRHLDRRITTAGVQITTMVAATGSTLTDLYGIGPLIAGTILARVGTVNRFRSAAAFACHNGTAPIEVSSGDVVRHRLSRAGDRQLNHALHMMAITQLSGDTAGRAYYRRKQLPARTIKKTAAVTGTRPDKPTLASFRGDQPFATSSGTPVRGGARRERRHGRWAARRSTRTVEGVTQRL